MNKKIVGIIGTILSIIVLLYFENFSYKLIGMTGINVSNYPIAIQNIINIIIKCIMCFIVYLIYKKDFKNRYKKDNFIKQSLYFIVYLIVFVILMYVFKCIIDFIGDIFDINIIELEFYNIFNKTLDLNLIIKILTDYLIMPYLYCAIILLGTDKLCKHKETFIVFSGIISSIIYAFSLFGTLGYVIVNSLYMFILFAFLAFIYKRENSIWFTILLYGFFLISNNIILNYLRW